YETMYLGFLWVFRATDHEGYFDGTIFIELVTSRDGVNWLRQEGDRPPILFLGASGEWDDGMIFTPQHPLVEKDEIRVYYGGFDCTHAAKPPWHGAIGLATLRKDGFASIDATDETGTVTTKRLSGTKGELHVNYRATDGWLKVEVLDQHGNILPGYGRADCSVLKGDSVDQKVTWHTKTMMPAQTKPIRLRFIMKNASIYSFMAGDSVDVLDESTKPILAALYTFENDQWRHVIDKLTKDGTQKLDLPENLRIDTKPENAAFGTHSMPVGSKYSPLNAMEIKKTSNLGRHFTLAVMAKSENDKHARLFSSYDDIGPIKTSELVFDYDPSGKVIAGLRLICQGIAMESKPLSFADGRYHHLAVTYDQGRITFYLDGENVGNGLVPGGTPILMERNLFVGEDAEHGREEQFRGHIDDLLVLGRALSAEEIKQLATQGAASLTALAHDSH
ncbi:MAG: LamG domain-containing protein, partial [Planctomycetota bacterium]